MFGQYYHGAIRKYVISFGNLFNYIIIQRLDLNGNRIDLTSEQYTDHGLQPPYEKAEKSSPLGFSSYRKRVDLLEQRVLTKLNGESAITFE